MKVHLMGIGGAGVSALTRVYLARGDEVSGCDSQASDTTAELEDAGVTIDVGHDPEHVLGLGPPTSSSPARPMTRFELARYLDYCSEMLSLTSKLAVLYVERFDDAAVLASVNDVQALTSGLSNKIWQKIMILDTSPRLPESRSV